MNTSILIIGTIALLFCIFWLIAYPEEVWDTLRFRKAPFHLSVFLWLSFVMSACAVTGWIWLGVSFSTATTRASGQITSPQAGVGQVVVLRNGIYTNVDFYDGYIRGYAESIFYANHSRMPTNEAEYSAWTNKVTREYRATFHGGDVQGGGIGEAGKNNVIRAE